MPELTEEQLKQMQEKVKSMSPEELKEFQKQQCIFCHIVSGKAVAKKIYEDDHCMAILDINPANPGHLLLMPKEHYQIMPLIPEDELKHLAMVAKALSHILLKSLKAQGTNIFIANGTVAGQKAQHFMVHIIPRKEGDNIGLEIPEKKISKKELLDVKEKLKGKIDIMFGKKKEEIVLEEKPEVIKETMPEKKEEEKEEEKAPKKKEEEKEEINLDKIAELIK